MSISDVKFNAFPFESSPLSWKRTINTLILVSVSGTTKRTVNNSWRGKRAGALIYLLFVGASE